MLLRRMVFGLVAATALCGVASAQPPGTGGPLSEGRELDPVAREHYLSVVPAAPAAPRADARPGDLVNAALKLFSEALLRELTIPLGTVRPDASR